MSDPYIGQIQPFGFNFAPRSWAMCDGQLLPIAQYTALFSLFGTIYGGDGRTTFGLPDLRGRAALHMGTGPGLTNRRIGEKSGAESVTLTTQQIPSHNHATRVFNQAPNTGDPTNGGPANTSQIPLQIYHNAPNTDGAPTANTGGSLSHPNMQPYLVINWCVALQGIFPSRN
jgi:microcystin-dependent protein